MGLGVTWYFSRRILYLGISVHGEIGLKRSTVTRAPVIKPLFIPAQETRPGVSQGPPGHLFSTFRRLATTRSCTQVAPNL